MYAIDWAWLPRSTSMASGLTPDTASFRAWTDGTPRVISMITYQSPTVLRFWLDAPTPASSAKISFDVTDSNLTNSAGVKAVPMMQMVTGPPFPA